MGSFNTTCAISRTPILEGQKARVFFLVWNDSTYHYDKREKGFFSTSEMGVQCYPYDKYKVIGVPLLATYEDYNNYEFENNKLAEFVLKEINKIYIPNKIAMDKEERNYNRVHDYLDIEKISDMHQLQNMEHSGSLRVKGSHGISYISKMAIHEEIYQEMILTGVCSLFPRKHDYDTYENTCKKLIEEFVNVEGGLLRLPEKHRNAVLKRKEELSSKLGEKDDDGKVITQEYINEEIQEWIDLYSSFRSSDGRAYLEWSFLNYDLFYYKDEYPECAEDIICGIVGGCLTSMWFMSNGMSFEPIILAGQEYDFTSDSQRFMDMAKIVGKFKSRWEDNDEIKVEYEYTVKASLSFKDMEEKLSYELKNDEDLSNAFHSFKSLFEKNELVSFISGDGSDFDNFIEEYEIAELPYNTKIFFVE